MFNKYTTVKIQIKILINIYTFIHEDVVLHITVARVDYPCNGSDPRSTCFSRHTLFFCNDTNVYSKWYWCNIIIINKNINANSINIIIKKKVDAVEYDRIYLTPAWLVAGQQYVQPLHAIFYHIWMVWFTIYYAK